MIGTNTSDQNLKVKLFIEGVRIPFQQITITSNKHSHPNATVSIPPLPGLNGIARYYLPKVHIFYRDLDYVGDESGESKDDYKLLFSGIVSSSGYHRSSGQSASSSITFRCVHKNIAMNGITLQHHGRGAQSVTSATDDSVAVPLTFNSQQSMLAALQGIDIDAKQLDKDDSKTLTTENNRSLIPSMLDNKDKYFNRLQGIPGTLLNYWNQLKRDTYLIKNGGGTISTESMTDMYIPLTEEGLLFFNRMSGHPYLESIIDSSREDISGDAKEGYKEGEVAKVIVPPTLRESIGSAAGSHLSAVMTKVGMAFSGESSNFPRMLAGLAQYLEYDMITLTSPAKIHDGLPAIETVVKPKLPIYYAPKCNVLTANLYDSIQISEEVLSTPTRLLCNHYFMVAQTDNVLKFRSPQSVREAISEVIPLGSMNDSLSGSRDKVGKYEWGVGIRSAQIAVPSWIQYLYAGEDPNIVEVHGDSISSEHIDNIITSFKEQYGDGRGIYPNRLIPWHKDSQLNTYKRIIMSSLDQMYTATIASMRHGTVSGVFNPYVIAGYPIDIVGSDELSPSYHGFCDSVTHTITERSINTAYGISSTMTYEEMYSYYLPPVSPWLIAQLGLDTKLSLVDNDKALIAATEFYNKVLGVGAAPLEVLQDFNTGRPNPISPGDPTGKMDKSYTSRMSSFNIHKNGFNSLRDMEGGPELNPNLTVQGGLSLVKRDIETLGDYENSFGVTFIDVDFDRYMPTSLSSTVGVPKNSLYTNKLEPGQSPYLDYDPKSYSVPVKETPDVEGDLKEVDKVIVADHNNFKTLLG